MILLKAKRMTKLIPVTIEHPDGHEEDTVLEVEYPDQLEAITAYRSMLRVGSDHVWLADDDAVPKGDPRRCRPRDLPVIDKPGTPIHGLRLAPMVMSGMGDMLINDDGELVPVEGEPEPIEVIE